MASTKNMVITERGLNTLSRELLNRRKFQKRLISIIGNPTLADGLAFSIDNENYFKHSGLAFSDIDKVSISFKGVYLSSNQEDKGQVLWSLTGINSESLTLVMFNDKISLYKGSSNIGDIAVGPFSNNKELSIKVSLGKEDFIATCIYDNKYSIISDKLLDMLNFKSYTTVIIGSQPPYDPWLGNVDLNEFIIYKNKSVYYAPSTEASFHFTKVLISNGNIPLTDTSTPLLNSIYEFGISEIKRTGNNLLLLANISSDVYLNVKEVGLYSYTDEGPMLFSKITGLSIRKQRDLGYGLLFNVNLELGVVNTVALPEIVVHTQDTITQKDFLTAKRVHTYIDIDMERIIAMNALTLGRGRLQKVQSNYAKLSSWTNNSNNTQNFLKSNENVQNFLKADDKIGSYEERTFNKDKLNVEGSLEVTDEGVASNFSNANYATVRCMGTDANTWKYATSFKLNEINVAQTVIDAYGRTVVDPLVIEVSSDNDCFVTLGERESLSIFNDMLNVSVEYNRDNYRDLIGPDNTDSFYAWKNRSGAPYTNAHVIFKGELESKNGVIKGFSSTNYAVSPTSWVPGKEFSLDLSFSKDMSPIQGEQVLLSADKDFVFQISMNQERRLLYRVGNGITWYNSSGYLGKTRVLSENEQKVRVSFDGSTYESNYLIDNEKVTLDWTFKSPEEMPEFTAIFGQKSDHTDTWGGYINLLESEASFQGNAWTGAVSSPYIYTKEIDPKPFSFLYDEEQYDFKNVSITNIVKGILFKEKLFKVSKLVDYYVSIEHVGSTYKIYAKEGGLPKELVFERVSTREINPTSEVFLGINKEKTNYIQGTMYLEDTDVIIGDNDYSPVDKVIKEKNLKDFFYITEYPYSSFKSVNLKDPEGSIIQISEGALTGTKDNIDFSNSKGFSLCVKMFLRDGADKVILAKVKETGSKYFVLEYKDRALTFTLYQNEGKIVLKKQYEEATFRQLTEYPTTIFITYNGNPYTASLKMYKNNALLDEFTEPMLGFISVKDFILTNYVDFKVPSEVNDVINIISFEGELSKDEIFLLNNLLDTNF